MINKGFNALTLRNGRFGVLKGLGVSQERWLNESSEGLYLALPLHCERGSTAYFWHMFKNRSTEDGASKRWDSAGTEDLQLGSLSREISVMLSI